MTWRIAVVGGGISGLSAALALEPLARAGRVEVDLFEREPRWGGAIRTHRQGDLVIDGGPDCFLARKPEAVELCRQLGLQGRLLGLRPETMGAYLVLSGTLQRMPPGWVMGIPPGVRPLFASGLISTRAKLRALADLVPGRPVRGDRSLGAFLRARLGDELVSRLAEPIMAGIYAGELDVLSLESCAPELVALARGGSSLIRGMARARARRTGGSPFLTVDSGMQGMVDAAVAHLRAVRLHPGRAVVAVAAMPGGYQLEVAGEGSRSVDGLVLALPAPEAAALLESGAPAWADQLRQIPCADLAVVGLVYRRADVGQALDATGLVVPRVEHRAITAATWLSAKWPRPATPLVPLRVFLGRAGEVGLLERSDEELVATARAEIEPLMDIGAPPVAQVVFRHPQGMPQYTVGHATRMRALAQATRTWPGFALAGAAWEGVGIPDCIRSGRRSAATVLAGTGLEGSG